MKKIFYALFFLLLAGLSSASVSKIPLNTCSGSGDLYVYSGSDPFQEPDTSFTVDRDQLLIFTRGDYTTNLHLGDIALGPNTLVNSGFESGTGSWTFFTDGSGTYTSVSGGVEGVKTSKIAITTQGSNVQLYQQGLSLESGKHYRLTFSAYSSTGHDMQVFMQKHSSPFTSYGLSGTVSLTNAWQVFTVDFVASGFAGTANDARLRFWFSPYDAAGDQYFIDNVSLQEMSGDIPLDVVVDVTTPFKVKVYSADVTPGDAITVDATVNSGRGARGIQAYLAQDKSNPIYDLNNLQIVFDDDATNNYYLYPGTYQYVVFDKYTKDQPSQGTDLRFLNITITGTSYSFSRQYTQPAPLGHQGVVVDEFTVTEAGYYTFSLSTTDSVYWGMIECDEEEVPEFGLIGAIVAIVGALGIVIYRRLD